MISRQINFEYLIRTYYDGTVARDTPAIIKTKQNAPLCHLLRFYRENGIVCPKEINIDERVQVLLRCYSVMEVAATANFIPPPRDSIFWKEAHWVLENSEIREYYVTHYPMKLPQLLLLRIQGRFSQTANGDTLLPQFVRFMKLDRQFTQFLRGSCLLRLLDSFEVDNYSYRDVINLIRATDESTPRMLLPPEKRDLRDEILQDLNVFFQFCYRLHALLNDIGAEELLRSEIWNYFSDLFGTPGTSLAKNINDTLGQFESAYGGSIDFKNSLSDIAAIIKDLTSSTHSHLVSTLLLKGNEGR